MDPNKRDDAMNPYIHTPFFEFFALFFSRLFQLITFQLEGALASDEIQIFSLCLIAILGAVLGALLVFKKMTMLANALSHTILLGIVLAFLLMGGVFYLPGFVIASVLTGILTTFFVQVLTERFKLHEDAAIGYVFTTLFAMGIMLVTLYTKSVHLGLESIMGNLDALHKDDLSYLFWLCLINVSITIAFFKEFKLISFDSVYSKSLGINTGFFNYLLMTQVAFFCIGAFRAVGVILVLSFLVSPVLIAKKAKSLGRVMLFASLIGCLVAIVSVALSRHLLVYYDLPVSTAGLTVSLLFVLTLGLYIKKPSQKRGGLYQ